MTLLIAPEDISRKLASLLGLVSASDDLLALAYCSEAVRGAITASEELGIERSDLLAFVAASFSRIESYVDSKILATGSGRKRLLRLLETSGDLVTESDRCFCSPVTLIPIRSGGALVLGSLPTHFLNVSFGSNVEHRGILRFLPELMSDHGRAELPFKQWLGVDVFHAWKRSWRKSLEARLAPVSESRIDELEIDTSDHSSKYWKAANDMPLHQRACHIARSRQLVQGQYRTLYFWVDLRGSSRPLMADLTVDEARLVQLYQRQEAGRVLRSTARVSTNRVSISTRGLPPSLIQRLLVISEWSERQDRELMFAEDIGRDVLLILGELGVEYS